jgi:hypothetical protein
VLKAGTAVGERSAPERSARACSRPTRRSGSSPPPRSRTTPSPARSAYGVIVGGELYENLLPDAVAGVLPAAIKTELNTAGVSKGFLFQTYGDDRT